jgi:glycosyltransferase involved in cell wall biosynthesis
MHDLIPILYPQYFKHRDRDRLKKAIARIRINQDYIACVSESTKQDVCNYLPIEPDRVFVTPLAAAKSFHPIADQSLINKTLQRFAIPEGPYILSLATFEPRKNLEFLIRNFFNYILRLTIAIHI